MAHAIQEHGILVPAVIGQGVITVVHASIYVHSYKGKAPAGP